MSPTSYQTAPPRVAATRVPVASDAANRRSGSDRPPERWVDRSQNGREGNGGRLLRAHPVVAGVVGQLGEAELLEQRRQVHPEPPAVAVAQAVPAADRVARRTTPGLDRSV